MSLEALYRKLKKLFTEGVLKVDTSGSDIATETTLSSVNTSVSSIDGKITKADTDNVKVISEVAWDSTNDRKKVSIENDAVGIAKDSTLQSTNSTLNSINSKIIIANTDAVSTMWDYAVNAGYAFEVGEIFNIPASGTQQIVIANPAGSGKVMKIRLLEVRGKGSGNVKRYIGTFGSGNEIDITTSGTSITPVNKRPDIANASAAIVDYGGTYTNTATKVISGVIPGGTGTFVEGGASVIGLVGIIPEGYAYLIEISNDDSTNAVDFSTRIEWWEEASGSP